VEVKTTLAPGQNGTKQLLKQYGGQLVCVRYRYDKVRQKRVKTIGIIIDEQDWIPDLIIPADRRVEIQIGFGETELREKVKNAGGFWNPDKKAWVLSYNKVLQMGLERRVKDEMEGL